MMSNVLVFHPSVKMYCHINLMANPLDVCNVIVKDAVLTAAFWVSLNTCNYSYHSGFDKASAEYSHLSNSIVGFENVTVYNVFSVLV